MYGVSLSVAGTAHTRLRTNAEQTRRGQGSARERRSSLAAGSLPLGSMTSPCRRRALLRLRLLPTRPPSPHQSLAPLPPPRRPAPPLRRLPPSSRSFAPPASPASLPRAPARARRRSGNDDDNGYVSWKRNDVSATRFHGPEGRPFKRVRGGGRIDGRGVGREREPLSRGRRWEEEPGENGVEASATRVVFSPPRFLPRLLWLCPFSAATAHPSLRFSFLSLRRTALSLPLFSAGRGWGRSPPLRDERTPGSLVQCTLSSGATLSLPDSASNP